ncbi:MAG: phage portal protein [Agathobacter sp.]
MLTESEIKLFLDEDAASAQKKQAKVGQAYYEGRHDILDYRMFYFNDKGELVEDTYRSNAKIPHPFFTELVDQATQLIMSDKEGFVMSDDPELQSELDKYFNGNKRFKVELSETIDGIQIKGCDYIHAYKGKDDRLCFENADSLGVVEVEGRFTDDGKDQIIWKYVDRIDKEGKVQFKVLVIDDENTYYFKQQDNGEILSDDSVELNPRPHAVYEKGGKLYTKPFGFLPFFRLDYNKKKISHLRAVKPLIDDYDIMASSLTNNLIDFDTPLHVVKGFEGDNLDELQKNIKTKKLIGIPDEGNAGVDVKTVDIPYQARKEKLDIDEKGIYKFGMGLNMAGLKDTAATTNIAIKAAYSLLEMRCSKIIDRLELLLMDLVEVVIDEINAQNGTGYTPEQVYIDICPEIMSNAQENAQIELTNAQKQQTLINTLLALASYLDNELLMQQVCEVLDLDFEQVKDMLVDPDESEAMIDEAGGILDGVEPEGGAGGGVIE